MAGLAEGGGLLVAGNARDRDPAAEPFLAGLPDLPGAWDDLGQDGRRDAEQVEQFVVPAQRVDVKQHRPRRVADVGDVAAAELERQPAVDGTESQFASGGARTCARD